MRKELLRVTEKEIQVIEGMIKTLYQNHTFNSDDEHRLFYLYHQQAIDQICVYRGLDWDSYQDEYLCD